MQFGLQGQRVALLVGGEVPEDAIREPWDALVEAGAELHVVGTRTGEVEVAHEGDVMRQFRATRALSQVKSDDYVALVIAACVGDPHALRADEHARAFVREMMEADKPVAAIGNGVALLVSADVLRGRTVAAPAPLKAEIDAAGGTLSDLPLQVDQKLITARSCDDVPSLGKKLVREFSNKLDSAKVDMLSAGSFPASDPPPGPAKL